MQTQEFENVYACLERQVHSEPCYNAKNTPGGMALELDDADILHVAGLARLRLTAAELEPVRRDLNRVLEYVQTLHQLNLEGVEPTMHGSGARALLRHDRVEPSLALTDAIRNAPEVREGMFVVPRIIGEAREDE